jgi:hypothetical protein
MAWRVGFRDSRDAYEYIAVLSRKSEPLLFHLRKHSALQKERLEQIY